MGWFSKCSKVNHSWPRLTTAEPQQLRFKQRHRQGSSSVLCAKPSKEASRYLQILPATPRDVLSTPMNLTSSVEHGHSVKYTGSECMLIHPIHSWPTEFILAGQVTKKSQDVAFYFVHWFLGHISNLWTSSQKKRKAFIKKPWTDESESWFALLPLCVCAVFTH
jgi:hypothetical protein